MIAMNPKVLEIADALDRERAAGPRARPAARHPDRRQGQLRDRRHADHRRHAGADRLHDRPRRVPGEAAARRRRDHHRQDQPARARRRHHHDQLARRPDAQSRTIRRATPAGRAAAPARRSPPASPRPAWAATPAARSGFPSANNNLFGLRGTMGLSSRDGIIPLSHTPGHRRTAGAHGRPTSRSMLDATVGADPADAVTQASAGHIPPSYRELLEGRRAEGRRASACVKNLFGAAPDDDEVGGDRSQGARGDEDGRRRARRRLDCRASTSRCAAPALIDAEFKFDLIDYLARWPNAPVHSLGEILDARRLRAALEHDVQAAQRADGARHARRRAGAGEADGAARDRSRATMDGAAARRARVPAAAPQGGARSASRSAAARTVS